MPDPNVLNYFLIILGGFGVVWSYRLFSGTQDKKIGEFEYAAFSAIWGIPIFLIFLQALKSKPEALNDLFIVPMMGTPLLFAMGIIVGYIGSEIMAVARKLIVRGQERKPNGDPTGNRTPI